MPPYTCIAYFALWMTETAVPHEGNVRIHVVVTPVCTIFCFHRIHHVDYSHITLESSYFFLTIFLEIEYKGKRFGPFDQRRGDTTTS
jgi:hypothetical protein